MQVVHCRVPQRGGGGQAPCLARRLATCSCTKRAAWGTSQKRRWGQNLSHCTASQLAAAACLATSCQHRSSITDAGVCSLVRSVLCMLIAVAHWHDRCGSWLRPLAARCSRGTPRSAQPWRPARTLASPRTPWQRCAAMPPYVSAAKSLPSCRSCATATCRASGSCHLHSQLGTPPHHVALSIDLPAVSCHVQLRTCFTFRAGRTAGC
jgi:hypothetical protein